MDKVLIERYETSEEGTFGLVRINGVHVCYSGELPKYAGIKEQENEVCTDCIPTGEYICEVVRSPKFGLVYQIKDVPNRTHILIHKGNFCGDKAQGKKSNVLGCVILGTNVAELSGQKAVINSAVAFNKVMSLLHGEQFNLEIIEKFR